MHLSQSIHTHNNISSHINFCLTSLLINIIQSDRLVLAETHIDRSKFHPLTDYNISFNDRQTLKLFEDKVVDLRMILSTMHENLIGICDYIRRVSKDEQSTDQSFIDAIIEELEALVREAEASRSRGEALKARIKSAINLVGAQTIPVQASANVYQLCNLLNYENAVALKDIGRETQSESQSMHQLAVR